MPAYIGPGKIQFFDNNGIPLNGGQVWVYEAGSVDTLIDTYDDWDDALNEVNPQANPVPLNTRGEAVIIINDAVKLQVEGPDIDPNTGHGSIIWTVDSVAVADASSTSIGGYHFLNNTIANEDNDIAFGFSSSTNPQNYILIASQDSTTPPTISVVSDSVTDQDLVLQGQNYGHVVVYEGLEVTNSNITWTGFDLLSSTSGSTGGTIISTGSGADSDLNISCKGNGTIKLGKTSVTSGTFAVTSTSTFVGAVTCNSTCTTSGLKLSNGAFTTTLQSAAVAANRTWTLPLVDGTVGQALQTNGSGTLSFGNPKLKFCKAYYDIGSAQTITAGNTTKVILTSSGLLDNDSWFSNANDRFTPTVQAYYKVTVNLVLTTTGTAITHVYKNGSSADQVSRFTNFTNFQYAASTILSANGSSDYFEIFINASAADVSIGFGFITVELIYPF